jgi:5-methylcytosine-specific restriction enzyme A
MNIPRTPEIILVGYFLSRCGVRENTSGKTIPPAYLGTREWQKAYAVFFSKLGGGRSLRSFANTLKNSRDSFDAWLNSGRVGWRTKDASREPRPFSAIEKTIHDTWVNQTDELLWEALQPLADAGVVNVDSRLLRDLEAELEPDSAIKARTEGGRRVIISTRVERDPRLRHDAIKIHGTKCTVCGFDFAAVYGEWGIGFIEVHHMEPLGDFEQARQTDPQVDLTVVCANCHRMIHRRRKQVLDVQELRTRINISAIEEWVRMLRSTEPAT